VIYIILITNMVISIIFYVKEKCEIPLFLALFNLMVEYRSISLMLGYSKWVEFDYEIYFVFNLDYAHKISQLILLGTSILIYSFILFFSVPRSKFYDNNQMLTDFVRSKSKTIIVGLILFSIFQLALSSSISQGYGFLAKLGNCSFVILMFMLIRSQGSGNLGFKILFFILFAGLSYVTYEPGLRFQFLGWLIPIGFYIMRNIKPLPKVALLFAGIFLVLIIFSAAGVLRYNKFEAISFKELYDKSLDRIKIADDINFIDGFIMVHQVYPKHLNHTYGLDHLGIFFRPIPRSIWPDKPLAGWVQNYYAKHGKEGVWAAGFSPTLYGVFYSEMGITGIVFFSVLWAFILGYIYKLTQLYNSDLKVFLVGILLASLIPILRSGDLPGDFAIVLMSYWPILIFVGQYNKYLKRIKSYEE
jgi:hypothetical protein